MYVQCSCYQIFTVYAISLSIVITTFEKKRKRDNFLQNSDEITLTILLYLKHIPENTGTTAVLEVDKVPLQHAKGHLGLGRRAAHNRVERLLHVLQACERHAQGHVILVVGKSAGHAVKVEAYGGL